MEYFYFHVALVSDKCDKTGNCWRTVFSFELVNTVFYIWMLSMAFQVREAGFND